MPELAVGAVGVGAGGKDFAGHPNVVRVVVGERPDVSAGTSAGAGPTCIAGGSPGGLPGSPTGARRRPSWANFASERRHDLDPRVWPGVLDARLAAGAVDAWLAPIVMKKGRPAFTVHALAGPMPRTPSPTCCLPHTTTLGVREVG